jgi:hypothetical protein
MCTHLLIFLSQSGFLSQFCDVATVANHLQEDLARFGYKSEMNVKKFKNLAILYSLIGFSN